MISWSTIYVNSSHHKIQKNFKPWILVENMRLLRNSNFSSIDSQYYFWPSHELFYFSDESGHCSFSIHTTIILLKQDEKEKNKKKLHLIDRVSFNDLSKLRRHRHQWRWKIKSKRGKKREFEYLRVWIFAYLF